MAVKNRARDVGTPERVLSWTRAACLARRDENLARFRQNNVGRGRNRAPHPFFLANAAIAFAVGAGASLRTADETAMTPRLK